MKWFLGTYTLRFNRRHGVSGHLFSGRYKALLVDPGQPDYLRTVCEYVHLNPVRAQLLQPTEPLQAYRWSSYPAYLEQNRRRPAWLQVERVLGVMGIPKESSAGRKQFERLMEERRREENPEDYAGIRRGWCWGDESFRRELVAQLESGGAALNSGVELQEPATEKAERLARSHGVAIQSINADLNQYSIRAESYDAILNINFVLRSLIPRMKRGLRRGGVVIFEARLDPRGAQGFRPGELRSLFADFEILVDREATGTAEPVVSLVARKP
jgi:hypothetical protein